MTTLPTSITAARNLADALRDGRWDDVPRLNTVWQQADPIGHTLRHAAASAAAETGGEMPNPCEFCASCRERAAGSCARTWPRRRSPRSDIACSSNPTGAT